MVSLKHHIHSHGANYYKHIDNIVTHNNSTMQDIEYNLEEIKIYKLFAIAFAKNSLPHSLIEDIYFKNANRMIK